MFCPNCATPRSPGLSYCNRCGADLREKKESDNTAVISSLLTAITTLGIVGLAIMLGGAVVLKRKADVDEALIGVFMLFTFLLVSMTEIMLVRNLSKLTLSSESRKSFPAPPLSERRLPPAGSLGEPVPSVTENTTRTLEYARRDQ